MKFYFLFKTVCRANGKCYYGVHPSTDIDFGTERSKDPYIGQQREMLADLRVYGRNAFEVHVIHAFAIEADAYRALERHKHLSTYAAAPLSAEQIQHMSDIKKGEKNPMYGRAMPDTAKKAISASRRSSIWIWQGDVQKSIPADQPIPEGWNRGRSPVLRQRISEGMKRTKNPTIKNEESKPE